MKHFAVFKQNCIMARSDLSISGVAVDDCATECLMEELFDCQSFVFCPGEGLCLLNRLHPDLNQTLIQPHKFCNLYISMPLILPNVKSFEVEGGGVSIFVIRQIFSRSVKNAVPLIFVDLKLINNKFRYLLRLKIVN